MRDLKKDGLDHLQRVSHADKKVEYQTKIVQALSLTNPALPEARRVLRHMQLDASTTEMNRALSCYERDDVLRPKIS